ncbi:NfeD family protein [Phenylobacterium montanum]|uniref:NfeD family protein n=1 Tax=Phenylobacterium montanum TaxID=2823693 RepID=A0A975FY38_9CAUL|nr:NfeD family protein [Caulobacter sp. S6]QUD87598.1 NfeD family protein [Caulobacter sp. S6]
MQTAEMFVLSHPFWDWIAAGALLLVLELSTGSGYLLWPAASAGAVAVLTLVTPIGGIGQVIAFTLLTVATTYLGRRFLKPAAAMPGPDVNDKVQRLIGRTGEVAHAFSHGRGRVFVDGSEWAADAEDDQALGKGARVQVTEVLGGGRLKVKGA